MMFDSKFIGLAAAILTERCVDGATVTRTELCEVLGLDKDWDATVGTLIRKGVIPGYELRKGLNGGIGRVGEKPVRSPKVTRTVKSTEFSEEFLNKLRETCDMLCLDGNYITRDTLAKVMGQPGSKTESLISLAIKNGAVPGFASSAGRGRGVYRLSVLSADGAEDAPTSSDTMPAPAPEATRVPRRSRKVVESEPQSV